MVPALIPGGPVAPAPPQAANVTAVTVQAAVSVKRNMGYASESASGDAVSRRWLSSLVVGRASYGASTAAAGPRRPPTGVFSCG